MPSYTPWTWSVPHQRHYSYLLADDGTTVLDTLWSGHQAPAAVAAAGLVSPPAQPSAIAPASNSTWSQAQTQSQSTSQSTVPSRRTDSLTKNEPAHYSYGKQDTHWTRAGAHPHEADDDKDHDDDGQVETVGRQAPRLSQPQQQYRSDPTHAPAQAPAQTYTSAQYTHPSSHSAATHLPATQANTQQYHTSLAAHQSPRLTLENLPPEVQATMNYNDRRLIRSGADRNDAEQLDSRYRRVITPHHSIFFVPGRVFKMLWTEPAGQANPGRTRNSTHFSTVWCGEQAYSEIRRFVVVRNKGTFSQCIPVQTYKRRGATKPGLVMHDHGVIHTSATAPNLMPGENLTKYSIRVEPSGQEVLEPESRVNYGKAYAVEHNVKVLDIGMVTEGHRYLIETYFESAMLGQ